MNLFNALFGKDPKDKIVLGDSKENVNITQIYAFNLKYLVSEIEKNYNTIINSYGIETKGSTLYNYLVGNYPNGKYLGYLIVPVDENREYLVTKNSNKNFDFSNILHQMEIQGAIIPTQDLIAFIENSFQGRVYAKRTNSSQSIDNSKVFKHMTSNDNFIYLYYILD